MNSMNVNTEYHKIETLYERNKDSFKVDPSKIKNRTYSLLKEWHWTEKIDGTNVRCIWSPGQNEINFLGRTDNAQFHPQLMHWLESNITAAKMECFDSPVVLYGEGYGPGIQKGGGELASEKKFILFDVLVDNKWWLNYEQICDIATKLSIDVVPSFGFMTLDQATHFVRDGFRSRLGTFPMAEGLIGRPAETLFDKKGSRLIVKLKTKDF